MGKIITKLGCCSTHKKPIVVQFSQESDRHSLVGNFVVSGDTAMVSPDKLAGTAVIGDNFARVGCRSCGNKFVFHCGECGRYICYDGSAKRNFVCPVCGNVADVPAYRGSIPQTVGSGASEDGVKNLSQGQEVKIEFSDHRPLSKIVVGVGWDPSLSYNNMDIDSSVFLVGGGKLDIVYFGDLEHPSGSVIHHGDNLTGEGGGNSDDENITVELQKVPREFDKLFFVLNIYNCVDRGQKFRDVRNMYIRLYDQTGRRPLIEYKVNSKVENDTALILGVAIRRGSGWSFKAIGDGSRATSISQLSEEVLRNYNNY